MGKSWGEHFKYSMNSVGLEAPDDLFTSCDKATAALGAMLAALRTVGTEAARSMTVKELVVAVARSGVGLRLTVGAATLSELILVYGGVKASFYVGALLGAVIYATEKTLLGDWEDKIFDQDSARSNNQAFANKAAQSNIYPPQTDLPSDFGKPSGDDSAVCRVPVNACSNNDISTNAYTSGWPTTVSCP